MTSIRDKQAVTLKVEALTSQHVVPSFLEPNAARVVVEALVVFDASQARKLLTFWVVRRDEQFLTVKNRSVAAGHVIPRPDPECLKMDAQRGSERGVRVSIEFRIAEVRHLRLAQVKLDDIRALRPAPNSSVQILRIAAAAERLPEARSRGHTGRSA